MNSLRAFRKNCSKRAVLVFTALALSFTAQSTLMESSARADLAASQVIDVTSQVSAATSNFVYSRASKIYNGTITVTNPSAVSSISGPIAVCLNNLTSGVTLANAGGSYNGSPYVLQNLSLNPGASISFAVQFSNPTNTLINFTPQILEAGPNAFLTTNIPYQPQQTAASYEQAPAGFTPVFTEAIVRHGSRGQSSFDATVYNMFLQAQADGALTPLGAQLGPDVMTIMQANALLDFGVSGITAPGYGNLTQTGINEEKQIAALPSYFSSLPANNRQILAVNSGVNRAIDSMGFFTQSLATNMPSLSPLIVKAAPLTAYPSNKPVAQAAGVNRFLLYFHKLAAKTDLVTNPADPYYQTYQNSLAYQAYLNNTNGTGLNMVNKVNGILSSPDATTNARAILETLFTSDFVDKIDNGTYKFYNSGSYTFTSADGKYTNTVSGDGSTTVQSLSDAANELYSFYQATPALSVELNNLDFSKYIPATQASYLSYIDDVQSFYQKGPGIAEDGTATFQMAKILIQDMFSEVDAIVSGNLSHGAKYRFTHGEEIMPMASIFNLTNVYVPVPNANNYTYAANPWRGTIVSPYAANYQWDVYSNGNGTFLVKMLYNEKDTDFQAACDQARYAPGSHFYDYSKLKACYSNVLN